MDKRIVLYTLQTFNATGGIQKMTRTLAYSLYHISIRNNWDFKLWSAYDSDNDLMPQYLPAKNFKGFGVNKIALVVKTITTKTAPNIVLISHINLAVVGLVIKLFNPKCKIWLIAHGIEVWRQMPLYKMLFLKYCDKVICVSRYTKHQMVDKHHVDAEKCTVLNNAVDPFMKLPVKFSKPDHLLQRYHLTPQIPVIFTLTRLAVTEQYKGHDQVIKVIGKLALKFPGIKYLLSGQYDRKEEARIRKLIAEYGAHDHVILTGFIDEHELPDHFLLADLFVLPSKKEGFGIVFIEALACGLPVICGNSDGSVDAIRNGELGTAINTDNLNDLECAITKYLTTPLTAERRKYLQDLCLLHFNKTNYMNRLQMLFNDEKP